MARRVAYRKRQHNKFSMFLVTFVIVMLMIVVAIQSVELKAKLNTYQTKEAALQTQIEEEQKRSEEIAEEGKRRQTKEFIEEEAKNKLGMVYEDEILFKKEE